jgi:hypothetical protein
MAAKASENEIFRRGEKRLATEMAKMAKIISIGMAKRKASNENKRYRKWRNGGEENNIGE